MIDELHRPLKDLRISVTDRCNFRCQYCMPAEKFGSDYPFLPKSELLNFEEMTRAAQIFVALGVRKIRLTGGEPLLRQDLPVLIARLAEIQHLEDIALTTNGLLLPKFARSLKDAGLKRINISLDSLKSDFGEINGRGVSPQEIIEGIYSAQEAGLGVKINMVVKKGMNADQIVPMAEFCKKESIQLRYIEFMDVGNCNDWNLDRVMTKAEILSILAEHYSLEEVPRAYGDVAQRYRHRDCGTEIGFITSVSETFCSSCTRARLSANGKIYTCLFSEDGHDLRKLLRLGASDEEITDYISHIWPNRADRYSELRATETKRRNKVEMRFIGG
ncbi:GTP 3',8-cyclase MoaA [Brevibacillus ginsengisoli]|uniref:GTP 3',8-cyclase MoaA n=1 Tax=Brevibacillus ginsengisoli TaxID=363854 RepID=UPI003CF693FE